MRGAFAPWPPSGRSVRPIRTAGLGWRPISGRIGRYSWPRPPRTTTRGPRALAFLYNLTCREKTLADHHQRQCPGVGLFVHLMMDMEWPYIDPPNYDYVRAIRRVRRLCRQSGGRIIPFVAFDAYRPNSVTLVTDALKHQSFVGV